MTRKEETWIEKYRAALDSQPAQKPLLCSVTQKMSTMASTLASTLAKAAKLSFGATAPTKVASSPLPENQQTSALPQTTPSPRTSISLKKTAMPVPAPRHASDAQAG